MKKIVIVLGILTIPFLLTSCKSENKLNKLDENEKDIKIESNSMYLNVSESVKVNSYNGFKLIDSEIVKNQNGTITVVLKFNEAIKEDGI